MSPIDEVSYPLLLLETRFSCSQFAAKEEFCGWQIETRADGYKKLAGKNTLSEVERRATVWAFLRRSNFPILLSEVELQPDEALRSILSYIDSVRLQQAEENVLRKILEEESRRGEELLTLCDAYQNYLDELGAFDLVAVIQFLRDSSELQEVPREILIHRPTQATSLEVDAWNNLSRLTGLRVQIDADMFQSERPSTSYYKNLSELIGDKPQFEVEALPPSYPERASLCNFLFDSDEDGEPVAEIELWEHPERRDEVAKVVQFLQGEVGKYAPESIQIVCLELDIYRDLLGKAFEQAGIPYSLALGQNLLASAGGRLFSLFFEWYRERSLRAAAEYFSDPLTSASIDLKELALSLENAGVDIDSPCSPTWLGKNLSGAEHDFLEKEWTKLGNCKSASELRDYFFSRRKNLGPNEPNREVALAAARSFRRLRQLWNEVIREFEILFELGAEGSQQGALKRLRKALEGEHLSEQIVAGAVQVTELLDTRACQSKLVVVLGLSQQAIESRFPPRKFADYYLSDYAAKVMDKKGHLSGLYQAYAVFRSLFCSVERVVCSFSQTSERGEEAPANFLHELAEKISPRLCPAQRLEQVLEKDEQYQRRVELLRGRGSAELSPFDGVFTEPEVLEGSYSPTELQTLADCPHRYFFSKLLKLESQATYSRMLASLAGSVVHETLERFLKPRIEANTRVRDEDLARQLAELQDIAEKCFSACSIDWSATAESRNLKRKILLGLDLPDDTAERGILKGWLVFERECVNSRPIHCELRFDEVSVTERIKLRGKIDRVDELESGKLAVIDYKTGYLPALDSSLQLPAYALAAESLLNREVERGQFFALSRPNRRDADLKSPARGVLVERLALAKDGRKYVLSEEASRERLDEAKEIIGNLDELARAGEFHQVLETLGCPYCEFSKICERNVSKLKQKLAEEPAPEMATSTLSPAKSLLKAVSKQSLGLSAEQEIAVSQDVSLQAIRAGAGSGKTHVLATKILRIFKNGTQPSAIVAVTFTEKAAAELAGRLDKRLREVLRLGKFEGVELTPEEFENLREARYRLGEMALGTIHSFCQKIISREPSARNTLLASGAERILLEQLLNRHLAFSKRCEKDVSALLEQGFSPFGIKKFVRQVMSAPKLGAEAELEKAVKNLVENRKKFLELFLEGWLEAAQIWLEESIEKLSEKQVGDFRRVFDLVDKREIAELKSFLEAESKSQKRKSKSNPINYWKDLRDELRAGIDIDPALETKSRILADSLKRLTLEIEAQYTDKKASLGVISFDDILTLAEQAQGLGSLKYLFVDEFQDTNDLQWEILSSAVSEGQKVVVGDLQQAIYGFRGGDIEVFRSLLESEELSVSELNDNYRSKPPVVNFVNSFFSELAALDPSPYFQPMRAIEEAGEGSEVELFELDSEAEDRTQREHEAIQVADLIAAELSAGREEIAVLGRSSRHLMAISEGLSSLGVHHSISHSGSFWELPEILQFQHLLNFLLNREDKIALAGVLRSALFGFSDQELYHYFKEEREHPQLEYWRSLLSCLPTSSFLEAVCEEAALASVYLEAGQAEAFRNIERFIERLAVAERRGEASSAIDWLRIQRLEPQSAPTANETLAPVILTTVHAAKGLEFDTVVLPFLDGSGFTEHELFVAPIGSGRELALRVKDPQSEYRRVKSYSAVILSEIEQGRRSAEERRLFYVACTRAKSRLLFCVRRFEEKKAKLESLQKDEKLAFLNTCDAPGYWLAAFWDSLRNT